MEKLKQCIMRDGRCLPGGILKVDGFINHQIDTGLMKSIADEFKVLFSDIGATKIVTVESSGIAPAVMLGYELSLPVVFVKKSLPSTMSNGYYNTQVRSFTKQRMYGMFVSCEYLTDGDRVLFIDDFLACGETARGVIDLCGQAGAEIVGMGFIIEKSFQCGGDYLRSIGYNVHSLVIIDSLDNCEIKLR